VKKKICRKCGCTYYNACVHRTTGLTCHWVKDDLCSACVDTKTRRQFRMPHKPKSPQPHALKRRVAFKL
jgi:hypothetical protein